jgi:hexosaminidase
MYFPRLAAFAEVAWRAGTEPAPYGEFAGRLARHLRRRDALGVNYRPPAGPASGPATG